MFQPDRSARADVRNPVLLLPATKRLLALPPDVRLAIADVLKDLYRDAKARAERSWRSKKGPMAVYWRCVAVYALRLGRALRPRRHELRRARVADLPAAA